MGAIHKGDTTTYVLAAALKETNYDTLGSEAALDLTEVKNNHHKNNIAKRSKDHLNLIWLNNGVLIYRK